MKTTIRFLSLLVSFFLSRAEAELQAEIVALKGTSSVVFDVRNAGEQKDYFYKPGVSSRLDAFFSLQDETAQAVPGGGDGVFYGCAVRLRLSQCCQINFAMAISAAYEAGSARVGLSSSARRAV